MKREEVIETLSTHNKWRRGDEELAMHHPKTIGVAIDTAIQMLESSPDKHVEAVREALLTRSQVGLKKYGVTTERDDLALIDWLRHLQLELMDASIYIEAAISRIKHDKP